MIDHLYTVALMTFIQALLEPMKDFIKWAVSGILSAPKACRSQDNTITVAMEYHRNNNLGWIISGGTHDDGNTLHSILRKIYISNIKTHNSSIRFGKNKGDNNAMLIPNDTVIIDDINIKCITVYSGDKSDTKTITITLTSKLSMQHIVNFIIKCRDEYYEANTEKNKIYTYYQTQNSSKGFENSLNFKRYLYKNTVSFENLFFPEKEKLLSAITKYKTGKLQKLNLLLHGVPGCGKTSIIKAMANELNKNIIVIKLSNIHSDSMLMDAIHSENVYYDDGSKLNLANISDKIYVFEDIDAEITKVLKPRTGKPEPKPETNPNEKEIKITFGEPKLTLSGILNALDGITEFNSVLIATTNHPENLDPAFTRYGRFNMKIRLGLMSSSDATSMIRYYYPEFKGMIQEDFITPAALNSYINVSDNLESLLELISKHHPSDI